MRNRILLLAVAPVILAACATAGHAAAFPATFNFDPTGSGNFNPITNPAVVQGVASIQNQTGNALSVGGNAAIVNFLNSGGTVQTSFQTVGQVSVAAFRNSGNATIPSAGLDTAAGYQVTKIFSFGEKPVVVAAGNPSTGVGGTAVFAPSLGSAPNFFKIFVAPAPGANFRNPLTGTGFNAGTVALSGHVTQVFSNFSTVAPGQGNNGQLDQDTNGDQYPGNKSVTGIGATQITVAIDSFNPNFIQVNDPNTGLPVPPGTNLSDFLIQETLNTNQNLPFTAVDPSAKFILDGLNPQTAGAGLGSTNGTGIGSNNGLITGTVPGTFVASGPDIQFQVDSSQSFVGSSSSSGTTSSVPEIDPSSIVGALTLLGGGLMYLTEKRSRKK